MAALGDRLSQAWRSAPPASAAEPSKADPAALAHALARLRDRLDAADMEALDLVDRLLADHGDALGPPGLVLRQTVHRLDFAAALSQILMLEGAPA